MLLVAGGIFTHLVLDSMWRNTTVLFWPFKGSHFPTGDPSEWFGLWGHLLTHDPAVYIAEMIGLIIMLYFVYFLFKQGKFWLFIRQGYLVDVTKH